MIYSLPEQYKLVDATAGPVTTNGGVTGKYVSLKNVQMAFLILQFTQAAGHATAVTLKEATAVAGTSVKTVISSKQIWSNEDTATSDTLVRQTDATSYTLTNDIKKKMVVIQFDPDTLDIANGFDVAGFSVADSSQATNFVSGVWVLYERYQQATPPAATTD